MGNLYPCICRKYIEIRYKLIQYIYDAMYQHRQSGKPICRPMFMNEVNPGKNYYSSRAKFSSHLQNNVILSSIIIIIIIIIMIIIIAC